MNKIEQERRLRIYADALATFGIGAQLKKALEELTELSLEIHRATDDRLNLAGMAEELADVIIMTEQLVQIFGVGELVCEVMDFKVARLQQRIEEAKHKAGPPGLDVVADILNKYNIQPGGGFEG